MTSAARLIVILYYAVVIGVAFRLPYEHPGFLAARLVAIAVSCGLWWFRTDVVAALFNGVREEANWLIFIPLTIYFAIVFGLTVGIEYRWILRTMWR